MNFNVPKTNIQNKITCENCNGVGFVKNNNIICDNCEGTKCKFYTRNHQDYAPYQFCISCNSTGYLSGNPDNPDNPDNQNNLANKNYESTNKEKKYCNYCLGNGYVIKDKNICNFCNNLHKICHCNKFISPYVECVRCYGLGSIFMEQ